jgi:hypothetical protein
MRNGLRVPADLDHDLPFTTQSALAAGLTLDELHEGHWRAVMPDVWIATTTPVERATWRDAARLLLPVDAVLCGLSALAEHGLELREPDDVSVHVSTRAKLRVRAPEGVVNHRLVLQPDEVVVIGRWMVTTPHRSAFDCVRWAPPQTAGATAEAIAQAGLVNADDLAALAERHQRIRGAHQARVVADILGRSAAA